MRQNPLDWEAFRFLQQRYLRRSYIFKIEAAEFAMEKCLNGPERKATGIQLARDLMRDGRRASRWVNDMIDFDEELYYSGPIDLDDVNTRSMILATEPLLSLSIFFNTLSTKEKEVLVLALKGISYNTPSLRIYTKVSKRTFRYILTKIRMCIKADPVVKQSFYLAINHWGYMPDDFISLIYKQNQ